MKKKLCLACLCLPFFLPDVGAFISFSETIGPNDYRTTLVDAYFPVSRDASLGASYTQSGYSGSKKRISYGLEAASRLSERVDVGAGFINSPESGGSKYRAWNISGGYTFGKKDFKLRAGGFFHNTTYAELQTGNSWKSLEQYIYGPVLKAEILRFAKVYYCYGIFSYSEDVNSFGASAESWSFRNIRGLGGIIGIAGSFPSTSDNFGIAFRIAKPVEIFGEWGRVNYERGQGANSISSLGCRYFMTDSLALNFCHISYDEESYDTVGFGFFW